VDSRNYAPPMMQVLFAAKLEVEPFECQIGTEHWLVALLAKDETLAQALEEAGVTKEALRRAYKARYRLNGMPRRNTGGPRYTPGLTKVFARAEAVAVELLHPGHVHSADVLAALFESDDSMMLHLLDEVLAVDREALLARVHKAVADSLAAVS